MKTIDTDVLAGYNAGIERDRLRAGIGLIERALEDGSYINSEKIIASGLGPSHLRTAKVLREELSEGGFDTATVRMLDTHEEVIGLSGRLLAVSRKKP